MEDRWSAPPLPWPRSPADPPIHSVSRATGSEATYYNKYGNKVESKYAVENVVVEKKLSELFGASWKMGTRYTCAITVSLDEILWDPAVEPWVDEYHPLGI